MSRPTDDTDSHQVTEDDEQVSRPLSPDNMSDGEVVEDDDDRLSIDPEEAIEEIQSLLVEMSRSRSRSESTSGILPPPSFMEDYERIHPGAASLFFKGFERQLAAADREQEHRHSLDNRIFEASNERANRGQLIARNFGFATLVFSSAVMVVAAIFHEPWIAAAGAGSMMAVVASFAWAIYRATEFSPHSGGRSVVDADSGPTANKSLPESNHTVKPDSDSES